MKNRNSAFFLALGAAADIGMCLSPQDHAPDEKFCRLKGLPGECRHKPKNRRARLRAAEKKRRLLTEKK